VEKTVVTLGVFFVHEKKDPFAWYKLEFLKTIFLKGHEKV
jgi:hypothetical protein